MLATGGMLTSSTPGSGVIANLKQSGDDGGPVALEPEVETGHGAGRVEAGDERAELGEARHRRQEGVELAVARLDADGGADAERAARTFGELHELLRSRVGRVAAARVGHVAGRLFDRHRRRVRQRRERQAQADRRVAGQEVERTAAEVPALGRPVESVRGVDGGERQHPAGRLVRAAREDPREPSAFFRIVEGGRARVGVDRDAGLVLQDRERIFERRQEAVAAVVVAEPEGAHQRAGEALGVGPGQKARRAARGRKARRAARGQKARRAANAVGGALEQIVTRGPERRAVAAVHDLERPTRQRFSGVPLTRSVK
jgi:hypothetical protein